MKESKLYPIAYGDANIRAAVVFVHGLGGDAFGTWKTGEAQSDIWPHWLAQDLPEVRVYSLDYDASPSAWLGSAMPLVDRATNVLSHFELEDSLRRLPTIFVCHSLGGLLIKEALRQAETLNNQPWKELIARTRGIVFLATPHAGTRLANFVTRLGTLFGLRQGINIDELNANESALRGLNAWYAQNVDRLGIDNQVFFETRDTKGTRIVDDTSANLGLAGVIPRPIDADHFEICKPTSRDALTYRLVKSFLQKHLPELSLSEPAGTAGHRDVRPTRFFISYRRRASEDARLAKFLKDGLEARRNEVFIDTRMRVGSDWAAEIDRRIRWCDYLIVLLSAESVQSEMVQGEIRRAHRYRDSDGRPHILPVRVRFDGQLDYELDSYLARAQYARWQSNDDSTRILEELIAAAETPGTSEVEGIECELSEPPSFAPQKPAPSIDPRLLRAPGGTIRVDSKFYLRRPADDRIETAAQRGRETVVIKGPRQVGKSSLMVRYLKACADAGRHFAFLDFQILNDQQLDDYPMLLTWIARSTARRLRVQLNTEPDIGAQLQLNNFIEDTVIPMVGGPITLAFDEVDRVLERPYHADFFSMLRLWHNQRAEPFSAWENVDLALVISTEPYLLIDSADRSPFNVTAPIELGPFSRQSLDELNARYGGTLSAAQLDRLHQLLGGHPYLTRLAYFRLLVDPRMPFDDLDEKADDISGPFGEHLRAKLFWLGRKKELLGAFKQVINNQTVPNEDTYLRFRGAGLAVREGGKTLPSNLLYARFFKKAVT
jgi:hypothetical protein